VVVHEYVQRIIRGIERQSSEAASEHRLPTDLQYLEIPAGGQGLGSGRRLVRAGSAHEVDADGTAHSKH
jgi:hypothetical protein